MTPPSSRFSPLSSFLIAIIALATLGGMASAQLPGSLADRAKVTPRAFIEHRSIAPGGSTWLGIQFVITPGWHVYWKNPGDTGAEVRVMYEGPDWASMGELHWPVPERYLSPGDLLDFVHEGSPVLLAELRLDQAKWEAAGSPETLRFDLACEWFVCKDVCLLETGTLSVEVPVGSVSGDDWEIDRQRASVFQRARAALPTPLAEVPQGVFSAKFADRRLRINAPGASKLTFFPAKSDELALPIDSLREGQASGDALSIRYRDEANAVEHLEGVLVVERKDAESGKVTKSAYEVRVPVRGTSEPAGTAIRPDQGGDS